MSGGQDPGQWEYEVSDNEAPETQESIAIVVRKYLAALDSGKMYEVYRLRSILRERTNGMGLCNVDRNCCNIRGTR